MALRLSYWANYLRRTADLPSVTSFTLCGWAKKTSGGFLAVNGQPEAIFYFGDVAGGVIGCWDGSSGSEVGFSSFPTDNLWFHWYVRCSGTGAGLLQAGWKYPADAAYTTQVATLQSAPALTAINLEYDSYGEDGGNPCDFAGLKLFDAVLTDAELLAESAVLRSVRATSLNLWTPVAHDTAADAVKDFGGSGRDWTSSGTPTFGLASTASGVLGVAGVAAATLPLTAVASGAHGVSGAVASPLALVSSASGAHTVSGSMASVLTLTSAASGYFGTNAGTIAATVPLSSSVTAHHGVAGVISAAVPLAANLTGVRGVIGTVSAAFRLTASVLGAFGQTNIYAPALSGAVLSAPAIAGASIMAPALSSTTITAEPL